MEMVIKIIKLYIISLLYNNIYFLACLHMTVIHENMEMLKLVYDTGGRLQSVKYKKNKKIYNFS